MTHPFQYLESLPSDELFTTLDRLNPQAISIILYFLPTSLSSKLMVKFEAQKKKEIINKMEILSPLDNESMVALSDIIIEKMNHQPQRIEVNGQKVLKNIMTHASNDLKKLIKTIVANSAIPNDIIRLKFEELDKIPNKYFQKLIKEVERKTLLLALKTEADRFTKKLKENLSQGAINLLMTDLRDFGAVKKSEVMQAQESIVALAYELETKGLLVFEDSEEYIN